VLPCPPTVMDGRHGLSLIANRTMNQQGSRVSLKQLNHKPTC